jgi:hypothetical protein
MKAMPPYLHKGDVSDFERGTIMTIKTIVSF